MTTKEVKNAEGLVVIGAEIDFRSTYNMFSLPDSPAVVQYFKKHYKEDPTKMVKPVGNHLPGVYKLESRRMDLYIGKSVLMDGITTPIVERTKGSARRKTGVFITIYDAYTGRARDIENSLFEEALAAYGTLDRAVEPQNYKGERMLNGNRFTVMAEGTVVEKLPSSITVEGMEFKINFPGKQRFCNLCQAAHGRACPAKEAFESMKAERAKILETKIYADSTARLINQWTIKTDVAVTSGAEIGHLAKTIQFDSNNQNMKVIMVAGTNEIATEDDHDFVFKVNNGVKVLNEISAKRDVTLIVPKAREVATKREAKASFLYHILAKETNTNIVAVNVERDGSEHPTKKGTLELIEAIEADGGSLQYGDAIETSSPYRDVQALFRMGCSGCDNPLYMSELCSECKLKAKETEMVEYEEYITKYMENHFPGLGKRPRENDTDEEDNAKSQNCNESIGEVGDSSLNDGGN